MKSYQNKDFNSICKLYNTCENFTHKDMLPNGMCPLAFRSVYPYMVTLFNGGWFNWVGHGEHVIANCPSPEGIAMYVKAPSEDSPNLIEVEVMEAGELCFKRHKLRDTFIFDFNDKNRSGLSDLYNTAPFRFNTVK